MIYVVDTYEGNILFVYISDQNFDNSFANNFQNSYPRGWVCMLYRRRFKYAFYVYLHY